MVNKVDQEMNKLFHRLVAQGKTYEEVQSILDSVYALVERIEKHASNNDFLGNVRDPSRVFLQ